MLIRELDTDSVAVVFDKIEDPRIDRKKLYPISEILFLALAAVLCGIQSWRGIADFGHERKEWLQSFMPFKEGIPSHQTIGRVFSLIKTSALQNTFTQFLSSISGKSEEEIIVAFDGKTLRGSYDKDKGQKALHILNACAIDNGITLGHLVVDAKTNEMTAMPELLNQLDLKGATITADALNTQKEITKTIVEGKNDYVLPVKNNHANLAGDIMLEFDTRVPTKEQIYQTIEKNHGRIDTRTYKILDITNINTQGWAGMAAIGQAITESCKNGKTTQEIRYYIMSFPNNVQRFATAVRGHWGVENRLHWVLDVTFGEDASRIRKDHAPSNMSLLKKLSLNLLRQETSCKKSVPKKMLKAALNMAYHRKLLQLAGF